MMGDEPSAEDGDEVYLPDGRLNPEFTRGAPMTDEHLAELKRRRESSE